MDDKTKTCYLNTLFCVSNNYDNGLKILFKIS